MDLNLTWNDFAPWNEAVSVADYATNGKADIMIAGGAVRDRLLGKPVSDIDVFHTQELDPSKLNFWLGAKESYQEVRMDETYLEVIRCYEVLVEADDFSETK